MPAKLAVVKNDGTFGDIRRLQPGGHFAGVQRIAVAVSIARDDHRGGIGLALPDLLIRRVLCENREVVRIIHSPKLIAPDVCVIEEVVAEHV